MTYQHTRLPRRSAAQIDAIIEDVRKSWPRDGAEGEGVHALIDEIEYLREIKKTLERDLDAEYGMRTAVEADLRPTRAVIHDLAGAFSRLSGAVEVYGNVASPSFSPAQLAVELREASKKFNAALDRLKAGEVR